MKIRDIAAAMGDAASAIMAEVSGDDEPQQYVELSQQALEPGDDELLLEDGRVEAERYYGRWSLRGLLYWAKVQYGEQLARMATYESLNYDDRDSVRGVKEASRALTSTLVALLVTLLVYFCHLLLKLVFEIRWGLLLIPQPAIRFFMVTVFSLALALTACLFVMFRPAVGGSGMPQVVAFLNGTYNINYLSITVLVLKAIGMVCAVGAGLFVGVEGPTIQIGLIMFVSVVSFLYKFKTVRAAFNSDVNALKFQLKNIGTKSLSPAEMEDMEEEIGDINRTLEDGDIRVFAACGSAVGFASAFRAPLAGVTFALEEAVSFFEQRVIFRMFLMTVVSYWLLMSFEEGFSINAQDARLLLTDTYYGNNHYPYLHLMLYIILGASCGALGHVFNTAVVLMGKLRKRYVVRSAYRRIMEVIAVVTICNGLIILCTSAGAFNRCTPLEVAFQHLHSMEEVCTVPLTIESCQNLWQHIPKDCKRPNLGMPNTMLEQYGEMLQQKRLALEARCGEGNVTAAAMDIEFVKIVNISALIENFLGESSREFAGYKKDSSCFYQMRSLMEPEPMSTLTHLMQHGMYDAFDWDVLLTYFVAYTLGSLLCLGIALPTGMVIPSLIIGASFGRLFGVVVNMAWANEVDPGAFAIFGAAGFWGGTMRMTLTITVAMFELTDDAVNLPGILVAVVVATGVGNLLGGSIYHMQMHADNIPFLPNQPPPALHGMLAKAVMATAVLTVSPMETRDNLKQLLESNDHNAYPVVKVKESGKKALRGIILRDEIVRILQDVPDKGDGNEPIALHPKTHHNPITVRETDKATNAYRIFRNLGLRHLIVVDSNFDVVGILTRKDFLSDILAARRHSGMDMAANVWGESLQNLPIIESFRDSNDHYETSDIGLRPHSPL